MTLRLGWSGILMDSGLGETIEEKPNVHSEEIRFRDFGIDSDARRRPVVIKH